jgi:hypothetical protein
LPKKKIPSFFPGSVILRPLIFPEIFIRGIRLFLLEIVTLASDPFCWKRRHSERSEESPHFAGDADTFRANPPTHCLPIMSRLAFPGEEPPVRIPCLFAGDIYL